MFIFKHHKYLEQDFYVSMSKNRQTDMVFEGFIKK
jgi:hypothetical protein